MFLFQDHDHTFEKTMKRFQPSKKIGCPSKVVMSRILKFPDYMVNVQCTIILYLVHLFYSLVPNLFYCQIKGWILVSSY
jgi:hypothetical protein